MSTYLVERRLPGVSMAAILAMQRAVEESCLLFTAEGRPVSYLRSTFTPGESCCRCLFEAASGALVQEVNDAAQIPYSRIILAIDMAVHERDAFVAEDATARFHQRRHSQENKEETR
ncbi:MAG: hypothetical protein NVS2B16_32500 [Chloroflexota bacterium]